MVDILFIAIALAFFALAVLYVRGCERIVGRDDVAPAEVTDATAPRRHTSEVTR